MDHDTARGLLTEMLQDLDRSAETIKRENSGDSELSVVDNHPADSATNLSDVDREAAVREVVQAQRDEVLAALARLDAGTYGRCVQCGTDLPDERLDARPEAARCISCQSKLEHATR